MAGEEDVRRLYMESCQSDMNCYEKLCRLGIGHDAAGYATPQGLRNVLIISATPFQWKHMIGQRTCRRNTDETRIVMLKIWDALYLLSPALFGIDQTGPFCQRGNCKEGKMSCGKSMGKDMNPADILGLDYPLLVKGGADESKTN